MSKQFLAYIPVLHQGYMNFFAHHPDAKKCFLVGKSLTQEVGALEKDIRAVDPDEMRKVITSLGLFDQVELVDGEKLRELAMEKSEWILPDEELMHDLADQFLADQKVSFESSFLRWDRHSILKERAVESAKHVNPENFEKAFMTQADLLKENSADWWRQVGGVIAKDGKMLVVGWNHHLPSAIEPYYLSDARASFHKGEYIELTTAIHSEASMIAAAAKKGISVDGGDLYITTFPCPVCAKLVAAAGVKRIFYREGYAMLDGESVLKAYGIEIFQVE